MSDSVIIFVPNYGFILAETVCAMQYDLCVIELECLTPALDPKQTCNLSHCSAAN